MVIIGIRTAEFDMYDAPRTNLAFLILSIAVCVASSRLTAAIFGIFGIRVAGVASRFPKKKKRHRRHY